MNKEEIKSMNIHQKILKIAQMAGVLQKTKDGFGYKYVPEEDIQARVTAGLAKYGVMLYHNIVPGTLKVTPFTYEKYDKALKGNKPVNEIIVSADTDYIWVNTDRPEERVVSNYCIVGQMEDAAQAFGAAETYGNRYYLMKQLQLATSELDPDAYRKKQKEAGEYEETEAFKEIKAQVTKLGTELIKKGYTKENVRGIVAKFNDGEGELASITSIEVCEKIIAAFEAAKKDKKEKKEGK